MPMIPDQISFQLSLVTITYAVLCNEAGYAIVTLFFQFYITLKVACHHRP